MRRTHVTPIRRTRLAAAIVAGVVACCLVSTIEAADGRTSRSKPSKEIDADAPPHVPQGRESTQMLEPPASIGADRTGIDRAGFDRSGEPSRSNDNSRGNGPGRISSMAARNTAEEKAGSTAKKATVFDNSVRTVQAEIPSEPRAIPKSTEKDTPIPLAPPSDTKQRGGSSHGKSAGSGSTLFTVMSSLAIVLGAFSLLVWYVRKNSPNGQMRLPTDVLQPLGRAPLDTRQHLQLLKVGNRLLLVCVNPQGCETLTEITDTDEVTRLTALCMQAQPNSMTSTFRQVLGQLGKEPAPRGFLGNDSRDGELSLGTLGRQRGRDAHAE